MSKGSSSGAIIVGSSEAALKQSLSDLVSGDFGREALGFSEISDLLLEVIGNNADLVILDTNLRGLPTAKAVQILRKCRPRMPVIVISDDYSVATGSKIMEQGAFYYMYKPFEMASLREIIDSALRKRAREEAEERR